MVVELPGYRFDIASNKYYKLLPSEVAAVKQRDHDAKKEASARSSGGKSNSKKAKFSTLSKPTPKHVPHQHPLRKVFEQHWNASSERRIEYRHELEGLALGRYMRLKRLFPDCLPLDESVVAIAFDENAAGGAATIRIGGSNGSIAMGLTEGNVDYPNDEHQWRIGWCLSSSVTSLLTTRGGRMIATCLGLPAQALIGTTSETISSASITLSPRKTSLWTSAISESVVALGCDRKVLLTTDPTRPSLLSYVTGSKTGDGAVYSLDLTENLMFAGTRKGVVKIFDRRSSGSGTNDERETRAEINIATGTPVTHLRRIGSGLVATGLDGSINVFDLRFAAPQPFLRLQGHVNSYTRDLGFDVWREEYIAAAGQDCRVRIWSLRSGARIESSSQTGSLLDRRFAGPVKALRFRLGECDRTDREKPRNDRNSQGGELWIANGGELECFGID